MIKINVRLKMMAAVLPLLLVSGTAAQTGVGKCKPAPRDQTTFWGKQNIILKETDIFKSIRGRVVVGGKPLAGVLAEVYNNPEGLLQSVDEREAMKSKQRRIAVCVTGGDGEFSFSNVPTGNYELRLSKAGEWDSTSVYIVVNTTHERGMKKKITLQMQLSQ